MYCYSYIKARAKFLSNYEKNRENETDELLNPINVQSITKAKQRRWLIYGLGGTIQPTGSPNEVFQ